MSANVNCQNTLKIAEKEYHFYDLQQLTSDISHLPFSIKILLENYLRTQKDNPTYAEDVAALSNWQPKAVPNQEISFTPSRVILQDFTGVPAVVDLAAMRDAMVALGNDPKKINPLSPVELVIDHSVMVDHFGNSNALTQNITQEFARNTERYKFLKWGQQSLNEFKVVPPGTGIVHQVNLEYLARVVFCKNIAGKDFLYPDTLVGTDSHTTMINALGILGWGVGGIEAEAAMLGQPISMLIPQVIGFKLSGRLPEGTTATDLVLRVVEMLREKGVVGKFVEFYGPGLDNLTLADRATIANMAPEFGATCGIFPIDQETLNYLELSGRDPQDIALIKSYFQAQGMFRDENSIDAKYSDTLSLNLNKVHPAIAGPKRPQDRVDLSHAAKSYKNLLKEEKHKGNPVKVTLNGEEHSLDHGAIAIAAITSCTNTSNPDVMLAAGLLAQKAIERGLKVKPWVKTSLAPGSKVVSSYLETAGLTQYLEQLGFFTVGYGCTTCIGNSGPLIPEISTAISQQKLAMCAVLSGNRNFEGRIHPKIRHSYLASPPLVVAYALAGNLLVDLKKDPLGFDADGNKVYLKDIWPSCAEVQAAVQQSLTPEMFKEKYQAVFQGSNEWQELAATESEQYPWEETSTYIKHPPYFTDMQLTPAPIQDISAAKVLLKLGDSITTDHISPAGSINEHTPAAYYLIEQGVTAKDFNSYGSRRGNHEVMLRGTFANHRLHNLLVPEREGGWTKHFPSLEVMAIFDAAERYRDEECDLIVLAGKEYGSGSSRDWAAKGTRLLGVRAVIAESFERIHRSNLIGMGVLPLQFMSGENADKLKLHGDEQYTIKLADLKPKQDVTIKVHSAAGNFEFKALTRIDTPKELEYYQHGGILHYVLRQLAAN